MKKHTVFIITILFFLLFAVSLNEIIRITEQDYPRSETYDTCEESPEGLKCCCERQLYVETSLFVKGEMRYEETSYEWTDALDCHTRTYYFFFIQKREARRQCLSDNYCGN
ncbi:MAG: hypothetical protein BWK80_11575 [Desulfobacteraceae bacterium IS3]|nr:MAG: hypothetical protein BWK80_11575 [Desulfobacteraceae bacterium IS3]